MNILRIIEMTDPREEFEYNNWKKKSPGTVKEMKNNCYSLRKINMLVL